MAKCSKCGKKGLFLKLQNGLCSDCTSLEHRRVQVEQLEKREKDSVARLAELTSQLSDQQALYDSVVEKAKTEGIAQALVVINSEQDAADKKLANITAQLQIAEASLSVAKVEEENAKKSAQSAIKKVEKFRPLLLAIQNAIDTYDKGEFSDELQLDNLVEEVDVFISPTVILDLQCLGMKDLRKRYRQNDKQIEELLKKYEDRYTTKANATIYKLMVIALRAELQNVLYSINYGKLEDALSNINKVTEKYFEIATSGNQSIAPTMKKFIGEINYLFQEAVKIEYEYYVQKERAKEEQRAIREQMRQEAEERRALEAEKKKIEKEESKFQGQITQIEEMLASAEPDKIAQLEARLAELQAGRLGAQCLITGESLGQVASQTIEGVTSSNSVVEKLPILRPLIGFDKNEIIERSYKIGSYETSILPYEDCCTVFLPEHPVTRPKMEDILREERKLDVAALIQEAMESVEVTEIE